MYQCWPPQKHYPYLPSSRADGRESRLGHLERTLSITLLYVSHRRRQRLTSSGLCINMPVPAEDPLRSNGKFDFVVPARHARMPHNGIPWVIPGRLDLVELSGLFDKVQNVGKIVLELDVKIGVESRHYEKSAEVRNCPLDFVFMRFATDVVYIAWRQDNGWLVLQSMWLCKEYFLDKV